MSTQTASAASTTQYADPSAFSGLLDREFKPKGDQQREAVEAAVRTLAEQALGNTVTMSDDAYASIEAIFLKIGGIDGESQDANHKNEIDCSAWSWQVLQESNMHQGSGGGSGKATVRDLSFVHNVDRSSPNLMKYCLTGKHIAEAKLTVRKAGGSPLEYLKITMTDVVITNVQPSGSSTDEVIQEQVSMSFAKVKQEYTVQNQQGGSGGAVTAGFDIKLNKEDLTGSSDSVWTLTSPSLVLEVSTQLHQGTPGDEANIIPVWNPEDVGVVEYIEPPVSDSYRQEGHNHPAPAAAPAPASKTPTQTKQVQTKKLPDPERANPPKTGAQAPLQSVRDANGNPLLVYVEKVRDWWGRWSFPWMHQEQIPAVNASKVTYSGGMEDKVKALIETATELTKHEIPGSTQTYLAQAKTGKKKLSEYADKGTGVSKGWCYKYVKIALVQAHVVDEALAGESASGAGPELERQGFKDVTQDLPDARWAAAGDVVVYRWSDKNWEKKKKNNPSMPNYGHIDVRSYEAYISDFVPKDMRPIWVNYTNVRIYRKAFDPMPTARIRAFLHCLRDYECQEESDDTKRYGLLNTALPINPNNKRFSSYKTHPWELIPVAQRGTATASGAYQIVHRTWAGQIKDGLIVFDSGADMFSPIVQDRMAVIAIEGRGALQLVRTGKIEDAVQKLVKEWSSLPGGKENIGRRTADGKSMDMAYFVGLFNTYLAHEKLKEKIQ